MVRIKRVNGEARKKPEPKPAPNSRREEKIKKVWEEPIEGARVNYGKSESKPRYFLWVIALISVAFCFFAVSFLFARAKVVVNPKIQNVVLSEKLSADKDSNNGGLSFDLVIIGGQESENVQATGEKNVSVNATGTVVIFNSFSSFSQNLSVDTKLEGSNGKVYKTQAKITVPGMSKDGTPGQVEVGIYAAGAGESYNSIPLDFGIVGFKGTPKYSKFIVRSKTGTAISGGFTGEAPDISASDMAAAQNGLKTTLQTDLLKKATNQIPDGYILYKDAVFLNADNSNISSVYNQDNSATLTLKGTLYGIILNEKELTKKIAEDNINKYDGSDVYIPSIKSLVFGVPQGLDSTSVAGAQSINFSLSGRALIVWKLDENKFVADLLGKSKSYFSQILSQYPNIDSATLTVTPIWKMSVPDQAKDVKVIVNYPS